VPPVKLPAPRATGLHRAGEVQEAPAVAAARARSAYVPSRTTYTLRTVTVPGGARPWLAMWDVSDLVRPVRDYPGRDMDLRPSGFTPEPEEFEERTVGVVDGDALVELIKSTVAPGTWDREGNSVRYWNGKLVVRHDGSTEE
jgi:hypothetical protein